MPGLRQNPRLLATYHALHMTLFPISIMTLFWKHHIGMTMTEILVVQGLFGFVMAVFEFPSGYVADRIGYKKSLCIASALAVLGWSVYSTADTIGWVIAAETILGAAVAMVSGSDNAMLYESLKETNQETKFATWNGRVRFWGQTGEGSAALAAGLLYTVWPPLPFVVQAVVSGVNLVVALNLTEPSRHRPTETHHLAQIKKMLHFAFSENKHLRSIIGLTIALGMSSFVPVWLIPLYAIEAGVAQAWIGPIWAVANYSVAIGALSSYRLVRAVGLVPIIGFCIVLIATGYAGLALSTGLFGFAWYFCITFMRGIFGPALSHEEHREIPSSDRAGFISLRSLLFRLTFLAIAPLVGAGVDGYGNHAVLSWLGFGLTTAALIGWLVFRRHQIASK